MDAYTADACSSGVFCMNGKCLKFSGTNTVNCNSPVYIALTHGLYSKLWKRMDGHA